MSTASSAAIVLATDAAPASVGPCPIDAYHPDLAGGDGCSQLRCAAAGGGRHEHALLLSPQDATSLADMKYIGKEFGELGSDRRADGRSRR